MKPLVNSELFFDLLSDSDESDNVLKNESTVQSETEEKLKVWESDSEPEEPVTKSWFEIPSSASKSAKSKKKKDPLGWIKNQEKPYFEGGSFHWLFSAWSITNSRFNSIFETYH